LINLRAVLIDDEYPALEELTYLLQEYDAEIVGSFTDPLTAYSFVIQKRPDVVFLDIDMPGINGLELGVRLKHSLPQLIIIYVTAYAQYALAAYKAHPFDYILKPVEQARFADMMENIGMVTNLAMKHRVEIPSFQCFGEFKGALGQKEIKFTTKKTMELLAFLLCNAEQKIYRDELIYALFNTGQHKKDANNLRVTMFRLRSALASANIGKEYLLVRDDYSVKVADNICDFVDFVRFVTGNRIIDKNNVLEAMRIIKLINGEFLNNIDSLWVTEKREWAMVQAEELIIKTALYYAASEKSSENAEKLLTQLIDINPFSEHGQTALLDLYIKTENIGKFNYNYKRYVKLMKEEMSGMPDKKYLDFFRRNIRYPA